MPPDDRIRILHRIEAAETVATFIASRDRPARVSPETRLAGPSGPWGQIVAMRNRLVHAYFDIDRDIVWKTASEEVPHLRAILMPLIT